jgi:hypothetical protein
MHVDHGLRIVDFTPRALFRCGLVRLNPIIVDPANSGDLENLARHAAADWNAMYICRPPVNRFDVVVPHEDAGVLERGFQGGDRSAS